MSVIELERAFEKMSAQEQEQFAEWYEARLAQGGFESGNEAAWGDEINRRLDEIRSGKVEGIPGSPVMAELLRRYRA